MYKDEFLSNNVQHIIIGLGTVFTLTGAKPQT